MESGIHDLKSEEQVETRSETKVKDEAAGRRSNPFISIRQPSYLQEEGIDHFYDNIARQLEDSPTVSAVTVKVSDLHYHIACSVASKAFPTVGNEFVGILRSLVPFGRSRKTHTVKALDGVSAVFRPGRMVLVLGSPQSGKSSLLKAVAGLLPRASNRCYTISGSVRYNGVTADAGTFKVSSVARYVEQIDVSEALMTVRETLEFAGRCIQPLWPKEFGKTPLFKSFVESLDVDEATKAQLLTDRDMNNPLTRAAFIKYRAAAVMNMLGLTAVADTIVGNEKHRGCSGGERRRVTLGEMLMGINSIKCFDEITTGLDAAASYDIINVIRAMTRALRLTSIISLLQPPPEVFELFDEVVVMSKGYVIYHGPVSEAVEYFASVGYHKPDFMDPADFLASVAAPDNWMYRMSKQELAEAGMPTPPTTPHEFSQRFQKTTYHETTLRLMSAPDDKSCWRVGERTQYPNSWLSNFRLLLSREALFIRRDVAYVRARVVQNLIMGLVMGTIFWQVPPTSYNSRYGSLYQALLGVSLACVAAIPTFFEHRPVFYKQKAAGFFQPSAYIAATTIGGTFFTLVDVLIYGTLLYFCSGATLTEGGAHYGIFLVQLFMSAMVFTQTFRVLAYTTPTVVVSMAYSAFIILFLLLFCGYIVPRRQVPVYYEWVMYINSMYYAYQGMASNEFRSSRYNALMPSGQTVGQVMLAQKGLETQAYWTWLGIPMNVILFAIYTFIASVCATYITVQPRFPSAGQEEEPSAGDVQSALSAADALVPNPCNPLVEDDEKDPTLIKRSNSVMLFTPVTLAFKDVWYTITLPNGGKVDLLKGITGYAKPGSMTALMGSSGAGKTTLLDVLAGRKTTGVIRGTITGNGHPIDPLVFRRLAAYVEQNDIHSPFTTVEEAICFSAVLRLPAHVTTDRRDAFVKETMSILDLISIRGALVGPRGAGLATEQRKRLTIAVELVSNPSMLFLDEPTSGLDSRAAVLVMRAVKRLSLTGRAIICTIHQPSLAIFRLFDRLLLLKRGGETVYFGDLGCKGTALVQYLEAIPGSRPISEGENPATWMLECIGAGTAGRSHADYAAMYAKSDLFTRNAAETSQLCVSMGDSALIKAPQGPSLWQTYWTLSARMTRSYWRNPNYSLMRVLICTVLALIMASSYTRVRKDTAEGLTGFVAVVFMGTLFNAIVQTNTVHNFVNLERSSFYRERFSKIYHVNAYALGWFVAELPYLVVISTLFSWVFYWSVGLNPEWTRFLYFWLYFFLCLAYGAYVGHLIGSATPNPQVSQVVSSTVTPVLATFAGFMISPQDIPFFWKWLFYCDPFRYILEGLVVTQWHGDTTPIRYLDPATRKEVVVTAWEFLDRMFGHNFVYRHRWIDVGILLGFICIIRTGFSLALSYLKYERR